MSPPTPPPDFDAMNACPLCKPHISDPMLRGAAASVGIEHGKNTDQMVAEYLWPKHLAHAFGSGEVGEPSPPKDTP